MLELTTHEVICPVCKKAFFPETSVKREVLCGEGLYPYNAGLSRVLDCKLHYFCSEKCFAQFQAEKRREQNVSRWKSLLERISKTNLAHGIGELPGHRLHRTKRSS